MQAKNSANQLFVSRLKEAMDNKGFNQSILSKRCNITQSTISTYLLAKRTPGADELGRLALALGVSIDWLWGFTADNESSRDIDRYKSEILRLKSRLRTALSTLQGMISEFKEDLDSEI